MDAENADIHWDTGTATEQLYYDGIYISNEKVYFFSFLHLNQRKSILIHPFYISRALFVL